jgi:hypothetical protein
MNKGNTDLLRCWSIPYLIQDAGPPLFRTALAPLKKGLHRKRAIAFHLLFSRNA